jgi:hypothetical protein
MKMGTIASPWHYDVAASRTLGSSTPCSPPNLHYAHDTMAVG